MANNIHAQRRKESITLKTQLLSAICLILLFGSFLFSVNVVKSVDEDGIVEIDINSQGTFLLADQYEQNRPKNGVQVKSPAIVDLQANDIFPGDLIFVSYSGKVCISAYWELDQDGNPVPPEPTDYIELDQLIGVFSETSELKSIDQLHRVPKAIKAPETEDYQTVVTHFEKISTDIPEDFKIEKTGTLVEVPQLANYLFICLADAYYPDNLGTLKVVIEKDSDGDGLMNSWEKNGIDLNDDDKIDLDLPSLGARWDRKDIFVEIDYMGVIGGHDHRPNVDAIRDVIEAFDKAPVGNPGPSGINLHVLEFIDEAIPHQNEITLWTDFDNIKKNHFGTQADRADPNREQILKAKKMVFHYCLFIHNQKGTSSSGRGELPGNDFVVSLGSFTNFVGNKEEQAGTFMHELGHNLGLHHGGSDNIQYKPNYLSVMNYLFQIPSLMSSLFDRPLTFSSMQMADLNENNLNENSGVGIANWAVTLYSGKLQTGTGTSFIPLAVSTLGTIDWNNNGDDTEDSIAANINNFPNWNYLSPSGETLKGHNDWINLIYGFRGHPSYADGVHQDVIQELTFELAEKIQKDIETLVPNFDLDSDGDLGGNVSTRFGNNGKIAFTTNRDGNYEIYVMNADGTEQTRLTNNNADDFDPFYSPDGKKIAFWTNRDGNYEIYVMNADGTEQTRLTNNVYSDEQPSWSPDGKKIAFPSNRDGNHEIYVMNTNGTEQIRLTNNNAADEQPRWSPDGSMIVFNSDRDGNMEIYVMKADGTEQTRVTNNNAGDEDPDWSPDSNKLVFVSNRDGNYEIYVMNTDGTQQTRLTNHSAEDWDPCWSPDGTKITFDTMRDGNWNVYTMNSDGSEQIQITDNEATDWGPIWQAIDESAATDFLPFIALGAGVIIILIVFFVIRKKKQKTNIH